MRLYLCSLGWLCVAGALSACEELPNPAPGGECPPGPQAPLGTSCTKPGLECRYGYEPIACGGRTVICDEGSFRELEHTDPAPGCQAQNPPPQDAGVHNVCRTADDCSIENVGNCCGYYPRCVSQDNPTPRPDCSGGVAGVCGWPEITHCECVENTCRSMQGDNEV
jgi:hypothetical protein